MPDKNHADHAAAANTDANTDVEFEQYEDAVKEAAASRGLNSEMEGFELEEDYIHCEDVEDIATAYEAHCADAAEMLGED